MHRLGLLALCSLTLAACMTRGDGTPATEVRELEAFDAVDVGGVFHLRAQQGATRHVELRGDANLLPQVELRVSGGRLHARIEGNVLPKLPLELLVTTPELREVEVGGAAQAEVHGLAGDRFTLEVSGASSATADGRVAELTVDVSGASEADALALVADTVEVESSGASSATVTANTRLVAEASGASTITWAGNAQDVSQDASGASNIRRR